MVVADPGTVMADPNAWQPLSLGEQIAHQREPPPALVVEIDEGPRRVLGVGRLQHRLARIGIVIIFAARGHIYR